MSIPPRRIGAIAVGIAAMALLAALQPGLVSTTLRSPRALAVISVTTLAVSFGGRVVTRRFGNGAGAASRVLALTIVAWFLVLPAFRQTTLDEGFPVAAGASDTSAPDGSPPVVSAPAPVLEAPAAGEPVPAPPKAEPTEPATPRAPVAPPAAAPTTNAAPATTAVPAAAPTTRPPASDPVRLTTGAIDGIGHEASGTASVWRLSDGSAIVRFDEIDLKGAPDPVLYLVPGADRRSREGGVEVAPLKATKGSFNHAVPPSFDLDQPFTVFIWCEQYAVPIANADQRAG